MYNKICPVCRNALYSENKYLNNVSVLHSECEQNNKSKKKKRPVRTSTPVAEFESSNAPSFSDSVTDFFYQSWKSGLHSDETKTSQLQLNGCNYQPLTVIQPVCYATHVVYVNTVIYQPYFPPLGSFSQQVGYRPDGTFGVLPTYWTPPGL